MREVFYKVIDGQHLQLDFHPPKEQKYEKTPILIYYHGGGFREGHRKNTAMFQKTIDTMTAEGFAFATVSYRFSTPQKGAFPDSVKDSNDAIRVLADPQNGFNIDPDNIFLTGFSAGATLALLGALTQDKYTDFENPYPYKIKGVFSMSGSTMFDYRRLTTFYDDLDQVLNEYLGKTPYQDESIYHESSTLTYLKQHKALDTAFFLMAGENDIVVPCQMADFFEEEALKQGYNCEKLIVKNASHSFLVIENEVEIRDVGFINNQLMGFVRKHFGQK